MTFLPLQEISDSLKETNEKLLKLNGLLETELTEEDRLKTENEIERLKRTKEELNFRLVEAAEKLKQGTLS